MLTYDVRLKMLEVLWIEVNLFPEILCFLSWFGFLLNLCESFCAIKGHYHSSHKGKTQTIKLNKGRSAGCLGE